MIREVHGDILTADAEALVNPVNTVGVMGAGLALQFKRSYPEMYREYRAACEEHEIQIGEMHVYMLCRNPHHKPPYWIINFPTKEDWRNPSELEWIDSGLDQLSWEVTSREIRSIAIPPLGCGLGGLHWPDVRALIEQRLGDLDGVDVMLYAPEGNYR
jgi:O-acetyl-ADP-ribose deacetylase (regulator of RNase III)